MPREKTIQRVIKSLKNKPGIRKVKVLDDLAREDLLRLEADAEKRVLMGMGIGLNEGLRKALKREVIIACSTDEDFTWLTGPAVLLKRGDDVIGFLVDSPERIKELKIEENFKIIGESLVLFPKRVKEAQGRDTFVFIGFTLPDLEDKAHVENAILGIPSQPGDNYLKEKLNEEKKPSFGTIVVGFDLKN